MTDTSEFQTATIGIGIGLFLLVCVMCYRMIWKRSYMLFILWPVVIYFCGPTFTSIFADTPVLSRYVFPNTAVAETLIIFIYFAGLVFLDRVWGLSKVIESCFSSGMITRLATSPIFLLVYLPIALLTIALQVRMLLEFGSVLNGSYVLQYVDQGLIPYWGFLAGLYEIVFMLFILFLLTGVKSKVRILVVALYVGTAALRVLGGTRLILIKELAVVLLLLYARGVIKRRQLAIAATVVVIAGSAVGLLRTETNGENAFLGPLYGLVMESGLNALTFNIAYQVSDSGYLDRHSQVENAIEYTVLGSLPSFLRFGITEDEWERLSPYDAAFGAGFDTSTPVGGMSGFATLCYLTSYPIIATLALVLVMAVLLKYSPPGVMKQIVVVVFAINAIHFWRDPVDIAVKLLSQDIACALLLLCVPSVRRASLPALCPDASVASAG